MIFKLPEYSGQYTHTGTNWYVFKTTDTSSKNNAIYSIENNSSVRNSVNINVPMVKGEVFYLVAHLILSNGSVIESKPLPFSYSDMNGKEIQSLSFGVETPTITLLSNEYSIGGDIKIVSSKIRPRDNIFGKQVVIVEDMYGTTLDYNIVTTYDYIIKHNRIPNDVRSIVVKVAHVDSTGTISNFTDFIIEVQKTEYGLNNETIIPIYDYMPVFTGNYAGIRNIIAYENGEVIYETSKGVFPRFTFEYSKTYMLLVEFIQIDGSFLVDEFLVKTINDKNITYESEYVYSGFTETTDFDSYTFKEGYVDVMPKNKMCFVDNGRLILKYFNLPNILKYIKIPYVPTGPSETRYLSDEIVIVKYKTSKGLAVLVVNCGFFYSVPDILYSAELTGTYSDDIEMITLDTFYYLRKDVGGIKILKYNMKDNTEDYISTFPTEYDVADVVQTNYPGLFERRYSLLHMDENLFIIDRATGIISFNILNKEYKYVYSFSVNDIGKSFFGIRLHGNKIMLVNTDSHFIVYDISTGIESIYALDNIGSISNIFGYEVLFKTKQETLPSSLPMQLGTIGKVFK